MSSYTSYLTSYNSDGLKVNGLLTIPKGAKPEGGWPAIVFVHGYIPPTLYETTKNYVSYIDYLAGKGHNIAGSSFTQAKQNTAQFFRENL